MSDAYRKDLTDKMGAYVKPNSKKSIPESVQDTVGGKADELASVVQPEEEKSVPQRVADAVSDITKDLPDKDEVLEKVKYTIGLSKSDKDSA